jgi:hypothetical protein
VTEPVETIGALQHRCESVETELRETAGELEKARARITELEQGTLPAPFTVRMVRDQQWELVPPGSKSRLAEATALLVECVGHMPLELDNRVVEWIESSRAPAQPTQAWHVRGKSVELGPAAPELYRDEEGHALFHSARASHPHCRLCNGWGAPQPGPFSDIDVSKCIDPTIPDGYVRVDGKLLKWPAAPEPHYAEQFGINPAPGFVQDFGLEAEFRNHAKTIADLESARASEAALRERVEKALAKYGADSLRADDAGRLTMAVRRALTADPTGQEGERG